PMRQQRLAHQSARAMPRAAGNGRASRGDAMKVALAVLVALSLATFCCAAEWPSCADVPKCPAEDHQKPCCDPQTKLVWQPSGCKAEQWSVVSGDPEG